MVDVAKSAHVWDPYHSVLFDAGVRVLRIVPCRSDLLLAGPYPGRQKMSIVLLSPLIVVSSFNYTGSKSPSPSGTFIISRTNMHYL